MKEENDLQKVKFAFIGSGTMAEAMISALLRMNIAKPENIHAAGPRFERGMELQSIHGIVPFTENSKAASDADIIILSIKPQKLNSVLNTLEGSIKPTALIITIVAGATIKKILSALGEEIFLEEEANLDMATALSGTGPAYVYLFMEALIDSGVHLGFSRRIAEQFVIKTIQGSIEFYTKSDLHLSALRNAVTSPGGTSAEALYFLDKAGFRTAISRAVWAAYERTLELGSDNPNNTHQIHN